MKVWLVSVGDQERNFPRKRDAVAWLRRLTHDERPRPSLVKQDRFRTWYYGPGNLAFVTRAAIDLLGFPSNRFYAPSKRGRKKPGASATPPAAVDPSDRSEGKASTRV